MDVFWADRNRDQVKNWRQDPTTFLNRIQLRKNLAQSHPNRCSLNDKFAGIGRLQTLRRQIPGLPCLRIDDPDIRDSKLYVILATRRHFLESVARRKYLDHQQR